MSIRRIARVSVSFVVTIVCTGALMSDSLELRHNEITEMSAPAGSPRTTVARKLALIVAVGQQGTAPPGTRGYGTLDGAANAADLIHSTLKFHNFDSIAVVRDSAATKTGILEGIRHHLIEQAQPGDVAVFFYSGHGDQLPDDGHDEEDGKDEVLVPYGAPDPGWSDTTYAAEYYVRDDILGSLLGELAAKVGEGGQVVALLDACHSGTGTRGAFGSTGVPSQIRKMQGSGFEELSARGNAAPLITISAGRQFERVIETTHVDGTLVSPLARALAVALPKIGQGHSFRDLYDLISEEARARNYQHVPQIDGAVDVAVFANTIEPYRPWARVDSILDAVTLRVGGGLLHGLTGGSDVELHEPGTSGSMGLGGGTLWATGRIVAATSLRATVELDSAPPDSLALRRARVFVTRQDLGDMATNVAIHDEVDPLLVERLRPRLEAMKNISLVAEEADAIVRQRGDTLRLEEATEGTVIGRSVVVSGDGTLSEFSDVLVGYSRYVYVRKLQFYDADVDVELRMVPGVRDEGSAVRCSASPADNGDYNIDFVMANADRSDWEVTYRPGGAQRFLTTVKNKNARRRVFISIMDLLPNGLVELKTLRGGKTSVRLEPGQEKPLGCFALKQNEHDPSSGLEIVKLFATDEEVDYRPYVSTTGTGELVRRGDGAPGLDWIFAEMFEDGTETRIRKGGPGSGGASKVSVSSVRIRILRPDGRKP
ncbi:caspase family protein [Candidatus Palauibacter sp.]|uniref:caspase family protein n=1 Tax=Candidatus Palauibacter sp. TaxID=3101350 RepID=UPI003B014243